MNSNEFILEVITLYQNARESKYLLGARGRSHTISSYVEDLFGFYLWKNNKNIAGIYIDQPLIINNIKKIIYPDIITINNNGVITNFFDIKMDLGWMREGLVELSLKYEELINNIKNKEAHLKNGKSKSTINFIVGNNIKFNIVIISSKNISNDKLLNNISRFNNYKFKNVNLMILTDGIHPNQYNKSIEIINGKINIKKESFDHINSLDYN